MGTIQNNIGIVVTYDRDGSERAAFEEWRANLPDEEYNRWRSLAIGPVPTITNGDTVYYFIWSCDGSKQGWDTQQQGEQYLREFFRLFRYADSRHVSFGELSDFIVDPDDRDPFVIDQSLRELEG